MKKIIKLKNLMNEMNIDAIVAMSLENVFYTTGAYILTQKILSKRLAMCIIPYETEPTLVVCSVEESLAKEQSKIRDIRSYIEFKENPIDVLCDVLKEKNMVKGKIGVEMDYLVYNYSTRLHELLPDIKTVDCAQLFDKARMFKTKEEIDLLEKAATSTKKAINAAFELSSPEDTEEMVAKKIMTFMLNSGADDILFSVLGTGRRSILTHPVPNQTKLKKGDIVKVDVGGVYSGYYSDVARNAIVGKPSRSVLEDFTKFANIQKKVIDSCRIGVKFCDLYKQCTDIYHKEGLTMTMPHIGHGLGVGLHENPMINPFNQNKIEEGMVLNIEPISIDVEHSRGYHLEDLILCQKEGPKILTGDNLPHSLPVIT